MWCWGPAAVLRVVWELCSGLPNLVSHVQLSYHAVLLCGNPQDQSAVQSLTFSFVWCKSYKLVTTLRSLVCAHPNSFVSTTRAGNGDDGRFTSKRRNADVDTLSSLQLFSIYVPLEWLFDANQVSKPTSRSCSFPLNLVDIQLQLCCALCISDDTDEALSSSSPVIPLWCVKRFVQVLFPYHLYLSSSRKPNESQLQVCIIALGKSSPTKAFSWVARGNNKMQDSEMHLQKVNFSSLYKPLSHLHRETCLFSREARGKGCCQKN